MRIIISIKFFTIGNFVEITIEPFKRSESYGAWFHHIHPFATPSAISARHRSPSTSFLSPLLCGGQKN
jgi:hypothetical protein